MKQANPLPIDTVLPALREAVQHHSRCLLVAQPGAGKTTRAPLALLEDGPSEEGRWLLLEPRRVAARLAASYMAEQLGERAGETVGYRVRGESRVGPGTRLEVLTQGILTRMLQDDPALEGVRGIIFDEFHERSLEADLGLALALDVQEGLRDDLKLVVMSATLDVPALLGVIGQKTPVIESGGRAWAVHTHYRPPQPGEDDARHQARAVREALGAGEEGHVLVFLPGQREIRRLQGLLEEQLPGDVEIRPLHGQMPLARQQEVLRPPAGGRRRVILSTAVAESSLTVPGVRAVVDAGRERLPVFQPRSGLTRLETRQVNRASADQRRGRAGREAEGNCYRLWPADAVLMEHREPEIRQADLAGLVFELARWGVNDAARLQWVSPPPAAALASAAALLRGLGLLQEDGTLSAHGRRCARWPAHPRLAVMLEYAAGEGLLPLACWLAAHLEEGAGGDETDILRLLERRPSREQGGAAAIWRRAAAQWAARAQCSLRFEDPAPAARLLALAYPDRVAMKQSAGRFKLATGGQALLPEQHPLAREELLVAVDLDGQRAGARIYQAIAIRHDDLEALFPDTLRWREDIRWDESAGRLVGEEVRGIGQVLLERRPLKSLSAEAVKSALMEAMRRRGQLPLGDEGRQLLARMALLHRVLGEPWPQASEEALLATLEDWLEPHLNGLRRLQEVDRLPLARLWLGSLDWRLQQQVEELAPARLRVPSGSSIRLDYSGGEGGDEPVLAVKLQEMFGQTETPRVAGGRVPVLVHLLSPAGRPVQVTRDLAGFWASTYFQVRKDLKGRYPKHPWPDDPLGAEATRRTRRRS